VKLDPDELLRSAGDSIPQPAGRPEAPPSRDIPFPTAGPVRWPRYATAVVVIFGALAVYEFFLNDPERAVQPAAVATASTPAAPASVGTPGDARPLQGEAVAAPVAAEVAPAVQPPQPAAEPAAPAPVATTERPLKRGEKQVRLDFDQESWVEIRDRN